jgi:2-polyprenyl-3-methyl-5-hydroxy-6-metoxy-1,4-benzoquinol methylase
LKITSSKRQIDQQKHFDEFSLALGAEADAFDFHSRRLFDYFMKIAQPESRESILELGCGTGRYTLHLLRKRLRVLALDLSGECLEILRTKAIKNGVDEHLELRKCSIEDVPAEPEFDLVFGIHILHHCHDIGQTVSLAGQRVRPGGRAVFLEPNPFNPYWYPYIWFRKTRQWHIEKGMLNCRPRRLVAAFRHAGFEDIRLHTYGIVPIPLINRFRALAKIEDVLNTLPGFRWISAVQIIIGRKR